MAKGKRGRRGKLRIKTAKDTVLGSDDEELYTDLGRPDAKSREYFFDEVDEFHENKEKILLANDTRRKPQESSEEEEVFALEDEEEEEEDNGVYNDDFYQAMAQKDEMASDIEGNEDEGLPDIKAWGKKKSTYYDTDYVDKDFGGYAGSDAELAEAEEKEALALQKRLAQEIDAADIGLEWFQPVKQSEEKEVQKGEKIVKDLSKLSKREKLELLKKESPEFLGLVEDFRSRMTELNERLHPIMKLAEENKFPQSPELDYLHTKYQLILNYCTNISFYMILKSRKTPVQHHPVIKRLVAYRNLLNQLEPLGKKLESDLDFVLEKIKNGKDVPPLSVKSEATMSKVKERVAANKKKSSSDAIPKEDNELNHKLDRKEKKEKKVHFLTEDEKEVLKVYRKMKKRRTDDEEIQDKEVEDSMEEGDDVDDNEDEIEEQDDDDDVYEQNEDEMQEAKRGVTYEIAKNKGLTPYRKKEYRNPRVRNRMKYRKAKIRRRGQVREVKHELQRYGGEHSGIRAGVVKSIKLKV